MNVDFTVHNLAEVQSELETFDARCFPDEMKSTEEDEAVLRSSKNGFAVIGREGDSIVCSAYMVSSIEAESVLVQSDDKFKGAPDTAYLYSICVSPDHQRLGLGPRLLGFVMIEAKRRGYVYTSAHIRTRYGWNREWHDVFGVIESRIVPSFWGYKKEGVEYVKTKN